MKTRLSTAFALLLLISTIGAGARAERIGDIASFQGVRQNALIGYGLVVGLDGSGDQTTQTPFTVQGVTSMLQQLGVNVPNSGSLQLKNVAAVVVTASLPAFSRPGQTMDVTVSSMGNAKSLTGGTLLMTPLKGVDGQIYAMAQGSLLVGGVGASSGGAKVQINHLSVGRVPAGATVERTVRTDLGEDGIVELELGATSFATASKVVAAINGRFGQGVASAQDGRLIKVKVPADSDARVSFLGELESVDVIPAAVPAKVIVNARTGSVVMNQAVRLEPCAVAHGSLSVVIGGERTVTTAAGPGGTVTSVVQTDQVQIKQEGGNLVQVRGAASLADVTKALNAIGVTPQDLLAILQAMKSAGALRADLEII
jgi:flagellar P-ring protein precursor FlgI